ncbi:MAG: DMT family transporter [Anaerolineae bacterium]
MAGRASRSTRRTHGIAALLLAVLLWGSTFIITKRILHSIGPFTLTFLRFFVGFLGLLPLAWREGLRPRMIFQPAFLAFGLTGIALFYSLQNLGLVYTSAGNASLIESSIPAVTALLSMWLLRERLPLERMMGIALSIAGVMLVSSSSRSGAGSLLGDALVFGAVLAFAAYTMQGRRLVLDHPPVVTTSASFGAGLLFLLPGLLWETTAAGLPHLDIAGWAVLLYLGLGTSALPMFLWNFSLQSLDASEAALYTSLVPVAGLGFALLFGEQARAAQLLGGAMAMAGVWLGHHSASAHRSAEPEISSIRTTQER